MEEIRDYRHEQKSSNSFLETNKALFENELKNGLGEQMIKELNDPPKKNNKVAFKIKIHNFFERLYNIL